MLRVTEDVVEMRRWAEAHGAHPCRDAATGRIRLAMGDDPCVVAVGWDEFEPAFCAGRSVFVYDDAPGSPRFFVGAADEARRYVSAAIGGDALPSPGAPG